MTRPWLKRGLPLLALLLASPPSGAALVVPPAQLVTVSAAVMTLLTPDEVLELMEDGRLTEAEQAAREAAEAHPESARAQVVLARILAREERLDEARSVLEQAKALPQWEEENISVPFESPRTIDQTMQRDPQRSLGLIADVLLAEGDDPKAYYLQSLAYVLLADYDKSQLALNRAKEYGDVTAFAHPDTLARLEQLLRDRPSVGTAQAAATPSLNAEAEQAAEDYVRQRKPHWPWWAWVIVGVVGSGLGWLVQDFGKFWKEAKKKEAAQQAARQSALQDAYAEVEAQMQQVREALSQSHTPALEHKLARLQAVHSHINDLKRDFFLTDTEIRAASAKWLAAAQTDQSWQLHQDALAAEQARQATKEAEEKAAKRRRKEREQRSKSKGSPSSFRDDDNSWSSGRSSSRGGNNGGSKW